MMAPRSVMPVRLAAAFLLLPLFAVISCEDGPLMPKAIADCAKDDGAEENDALSTATAITVGTTTGRGCIRELRSDPDYYVFSGRPGRTYQVRFEHQLQLGWAFLPLEGDSRPATLNSDGTFVMPASGRIYFHVSALSQKAVDAGAYRLVVTLPNAAPRVTATATPQQPEIGDPVTFTSTSTDPDGDALTLLWRFADGGTASGSTVTRTFMDGGVQQVRLVVTDEYGARDSASTQVDVKATVMSVELTPSSLSLRALGDTARFTAIARDKLGRTMAPRAATWLSSAAGVATVRDNGLVTAVGNGSAMVTARIDNVTATGTVAVQQQIAQLTVTPATAEFASLGETLALTASMVDARGNVVSGGAIQWQSSNAAAARVDANGVITAVANGSAVVSASVGDRRAEVNVLVRQRAAKVTVTPALVTLGAVGDSAQLSAVLEDACGNRMNVPVTWSSSSAAAVMVNPAGAVWALAEGTATVSATVDGVSGQAQVKVTPLVVEVRLDRSALTLNPGQSDQLVATVYDRRGGVVNTPVQWESSNASVASVSQDGVVEAHSAGSVIVTARSGIASAQARVNVGASVPTTFVIGGNAQTGAAGAALAQPIGVRVLDAAGNPVAGFSVTFSAGRGLLSAGTAITGADGWANVTWTLDTLAVPHTAAAVVGALGTANFTATAVAGPVAVVTVTPDQAQFGALGEQTQFSAVATDTYGNVIAAPTFNWNVWNTDAASVSATGLVTAVANGTTSMLVSFNGRSDTVSIVVQQIPVTISISPEVGTVAVNDTTRFTATVRDGRGHVIPNAPVAWSVESEATAAVNPSGLVFGIAAGATRMSATSGSASVIIPLTVTGASAVARYFAVSGGLQVGYVTNVMPRQVEVRAFARLACHPDGCDPADPVEGARFFVRAARGTLGSTTIITDVNGVATVPYTLPATPGEDTLLIWSPGAQYRADWSDFQDTAKVRLLATESVDERRFTKVTTSGDGGGAHACALADDGSAWCWGENNSGQLGIGSTDFYPNIPVRVAGGLSFIDISAAGWHTCGIASDNRAYCWGDNSYIGSNTPGEVSVPTLVDTPERFTSIAAGMWTTCAISTTAGLWCWGDGSYGALGNGTQTWSQLPVRASSDLSFAQATVGTIYFGCALTTTGEAYCWGANSSGQVGDSTRATRTVPTRVVGGHRFSEITAHEDHVCAIDLGGAAWCWGYNGDGVLGNGQESVMGAYWNTEPQRVLGGYTFTSISTGELHTCGVGRPSGGGASGVYCWGLNTAYAFGNGSDLPTEVHEPLGPVAGGMAFTSVSAGEAFTCGLIDGHIWCWGSNRAGETGTGSTQYYVASPTRIGSWRD